MIKVVSFDIGGTLIRCSEEFSLLQRLFEVTKVSKDLLKHAYTEHFIKKQWSFNRFCQEIQIKNPQLIMRLVDEHYNDKPLAAVYEDVFRAVNDLRRSGRLLVTISNKSYKNSACLTSYGLEQFFYKEIYSYAVGYAKPDVRIFRYVEQCIQVKPEEALHVGDSIKSDFQGARNASWHSILICRNHDILPHNVVYNNQVLDSLESLSEIIEKIK